MPPTANHSTALISRNFLTSAIFALFHSAYSAAATPPRAVIDETPAAMPAASPGAHLLPRPSCTYLTVKKNTRYAHNTENDQCFIQCARFTCMKLTDRKASAA